MREAQGEAELATVRDLRELGEITRHEIELVRATSRTSSNA
jgi:hypothetical protein